MKEFPMGDLIHTLPKDVFERIEALVFERDEARKAARYLRVRLRNRGGDTSMLDRVYDWIKEADG